MDYEIMKVYGNIQIPQQPDYFITQESGKMTGIINGSYMSVSRAYVDNDDEWYLSDSDKDRWYIGSFVKHK